MDDFKEYFLNNATAKKMINRNAEPTILIPQVFSYKQAASTQTADCLFSLLAGGHVFCDSLLSFSFAPLNCYFLLYTKEGSGKLHCGMKTQTLSAGALYFFDCSQQFSISAALLPWDFQIYFFTGAPAAFFGEKLSARSAPHCVLPHYAPILNYMRQMLTLPPVLDESWAVHVQNLLNNLLTYLYLSLNKLENEYPVSIPPWLLKLKAQLDTYYDRPFSLDECQEQFQINKYRICREFSAYFGEPPLRYLNHKRVELAKEMLLSTDLNVHEISSMTGYDNVNHFINQFKKQNGQTPAKFRQMVRQGLPVSHSPVQ